jgi:hypothetical protein
VRSLRAKGVSVGKLAKDFGSSQWMIAKLANTAEKTLGATVLEGILTRQ